MRSKCSTGNLSVRTWPGGTRAASSGGTLRFCHGNTIRLASYAARPPAPRLGGVVNPIATPFADLAAVAAAVGATRSKHAKRDLLAAYLRDLPDEELGAACAFFAGRPVVDPTAKLGMGWVQQGAALARASGADEDAIRTAYLRHSDFGDAAGELLASGASAAERLTVTEVAATFAAIAAAGSGEQRIGLMVD